MNDCVWSGGQGAYTGNDFVQNHTIFSGCLVLYGLGELGLIISKYMNKLNLFQEAYFGSRLCSTSIVSSTGTSLKFHEFSSIKLSM